MKIAELIEKINNGEKVSNLVEVNHQIPLFVKKQLVDFVVYHSVLLDEEADMMVRDLIIQELVLSLIKVADLSNIEIDFVDENGDIDYEKAFVAYDQIIEYGILKFIEGELLNDDLQYLVDSVAENKVNTYNSVGSVLKRTLDKVVKMIPSEEKINGIIGSLPGLVDKLKSNPEILQTISKVIPDMNGNKVRKPKKKSGDVNATGGNVESVE